MIRRLLLAFVATFALAGEGRAQVKTQDASSYVLFPTGSSTSMTVAALAAQVGLDAPLAAPSFTGGIKVVGGGAFDSINVGGSITVNGNVIVASQKALELQSTSGGCYLFDNPSNVIQCSTFGQTSAWLFDSLTLAKSPIAQPALPGQTAPAITTPTSAGTAPTGAFQLTAYKTTITSCPTVTASQQNAVQITASAGQVQAIANQCAVPIYAYPVPAGTLGLAASQTANVPVRIDVGMVALVTGLSATSAYIDVHTNYSWNDPNVTVSIPAIAANTCQFITITEPKARVGDRVIVTDTSGSLVNNTLTVSAIFNTATAGQVVEKACNVATLTTSTAASPTFSIMGFGAI